MQQGQSYRLSTATLGILSTESDQRIPVTIPAGATVTIRDDDVNGNRFVDVDWEGKILTMFAVDLHSRGKRTAKAGA